MLYTIRKTGRKIDGVINPTTARGVPVLVLNGESFYVKQIFSCMHIIGSSVYEKYFFQIRLTVLALKLDKERVLIGGSGNNVPLPKD